MTPLSQWFSFRCDTLIGRIKTIIYIALRQHRNVGKSLAEDCRFSAGDEKYMRSELAASTPIILEERFVSEERASTEAGSILLWDPLACFDISMGLKKILAGHEENMILGH